MKNTLSELWRFKHNIVRPNIKSECSRYTEMKTVRFGTYAKPLARMIGKIARLFGYQIRYRCRGERANKHQDWEGDIRVKDALFLCVYGEKVIN